MYYLVKLALQSNVHTIAVSLKYLKNIVLYLNHFVRYGNFKLNLFLRCLNYIRLYFVDGDKIFSQNCFIGLLCLHFLYHYNNIVHDPFKTQYTNENNLKK